MSRAWLGTSCVRSLDAENSLCPDPPDFYLSKQLLWGVGMKGGKMSVSGGGDGPPAGARIGMRR